MYHFPQPPFSRGSGEIAEQCPIEKLFDEKGDAMAAAAALLAGSKGAKLISQIRDDLDRGTSGSHTTRRALHELLEILALENVHIEGSPEAGCFAAIDPADPAVEEICLLTDELRDALEKPVLERPAASRRRSAA